MTTGTVTFGDDTSPVYFYREWSGTDDAANRKAWNPYTVKIVHRKSAPGNRVYCDAWTNCTTCRPTASNVMLADYWNVPNSPFTALVQEAERKAQNRLTDAIRGHGFDLGNYAAEGKETLGMALNGLARIRAGLKKVRKGDFAGAVRAAAGGDPRGRSKIRATDASSAHLGMVYGVLPLMGDIYASTEAWRALQARKRKYRASGTARSELTTGNYPGNDFDVNNEFEVRVGYDVILSEDISATLSLGLQDPAGIVWEGIPFSFVIDWFLPIGDYLDRLSILPRLSYTRVGKTTKITQHSRQVVGSQKGWSACSQWNGGFKVVDTNEVTYVRFSRTTGGLAAADIVRPEFVGMGGLRGMRIANAVALAHQLLAGSPAQERIPKKPKRPKGYVPYKRW